MVKWNSERISDNQNGRVRECFVISPIGQPGSEMRMHANAVHEFIIEPAFDIVEKNLGVRFVAARADHKLHHGNIVSEVIDRILKDDIIISVLSFARHNVYYELGIAHAAGRRPILLLANDQKDDLPFDISQDGYIGYNYDPAELKRGKAAQDLGDAIIDMLQQRKTTTKPFGREIKEFKPFGGEHAHFRFFPMFRDLQLDEWLSMIKDASQFIAVCEPELAMTGSLPEAMLEKFIIAMREKARAGVRVSIIYSRPSDPTRPSSEEQRRATDYDRKKAEYEKKVAFIERIRSEFARDGLKEAVNWVEMSSEKDSDCYLLTNEGCLIVRGTLSEKAFGIRTALWASSQPNAEFERLYSSSLEDLRTLSNRHGGGEIEGTSRLKTDPLRETRLEVFWETMELIKRARKFIVVLEPSFVLCSPIDRHDDDHVIKHWRGEIRKALAARIRERGFLVRFLTYDVRHPLFLDEIFRMDLDLPREKAIEHARDAAVGWDKIFSADLDKPAGKTRAELGDWQIGSISNSIISERAVISDEMLLAIPLLARVGHEACPPLKRDKFSTEYRRFLNHVVGISAHDASSREATKALSGVDTNPIPGKRNH